MTWQGSVQKLPTGFQQAVLLVVALVIMGVVGCCTAALGSTEPITLLEQVTIEMEAAYVTEVTTEKGVPVEVRREVVSEQEMKVEVSTTISDSTTSPVFHLYDEQNPVGESKLWRWVDSIYIEFNSTNLTPDVALTLWFIIFNYPEQCAAGAFRCGFADLGSTRAAMGDFVLIRGAGGIAHGDDSLAFLKERGSYYPKQYAAANGTVAFGGGLSVGDTVGAGLTELPDGCMLGNEGCGHPVGLINPKGALIIVALYSHGTAQETGEWKSQLTSHLGGCKAGVIGTLSGKFSTSSDEIFDGVGECPIIQISSHAP